MSEERSTSGYKLVHVHAIEQVCHLLDESQVGEERRTQEFWDWSPMPDRKFQVLFGIEVGGDTEILELVRVRLVGTFEVVGDPSIDLKKFVTVSAPTLLMPYVRQVITTLTAQGGYGALYLPPLYMPKMMEFAVARFEESTGFKQLSEDTELAERFAVPLEV